MRCAHCNASSGTTLRDFFDPVGSFRCSSCNGISYVRSERFWGRLLILAVPWFFVTSARIAHEDFDELGRIGWGICVAVTVVPFVMYFVFVRRIDGTLRHLAQNAMKIRRALWLGDFGIVTTGTFASVVMVVGSDFLILKAVAALLGSAGVMVFIGFLVMMLRIELSKADAETK